MALSPAKPKPFSTIQVAALVLLALLAAVALFFTKNRDLDASHLELSQNEEDGAYTLKIDPNSATWQELALLPNIGEQRARAIVAFREENGLFEDAASLKAVDGIGDKTIEQMMSFLHFEGTP